MKYSLLDHFSVVEPCKFAIKGRKYLSIGFFFQQINLQQSLITANNIFGFTEN
jgi:hypothetical protein